MNLNIPKISLRQLTSGHFFASLLLVTMCIQFVPLEGYDISPLKVTLMGLSVFIFIFKVPYVSKALVCGGVYWGLCYFCATFNGNMRFSTIGYLGLFVVAYIAFYHLIYSGAFTITYLSKLLRGLIIAYGVVLIFQQLFMLIGIYSFAPINLTNQHFLSLTKLPSLSLEPSHTARLLTVMILAYWRCLELTNCEKISIKGLFAEEHRWVTILFLWTMLTMGSGTAFIGIGILCLYFIQWRTAVYVVPIIALLFYVGQSMEIKQMDRAFRVAQATMTGNTKTILKEDGSASSRIIPIVNTLKIDLTEKDSWVGKGTSSYEKASSGWKRNTDKIAVVEQYGLLSFIASIIMLFSCMVKRFISLEILIFLILFGMSLTNIAYTWGAMMIFTAVRYFQVQNEKGQLIIEDTDGET